MTIEARNEAIEEILRLLNEQSKGDENKGFTRRDLETYLNCGCTKSNHIINSLLKDNLIEPTRLYRMNRVGVFAPFVGYKLTAKAQDKAAAQS
jgi:hypothetical protein